MDLNATYRQEGWGRITDQALGIAPEDVESQARAVARWAFDEMARLKAALRDVVSAYEEQGYHRSDFTPRHARAIDSAMASD